MKRLKGSAIIAGLAVVILVLGLLQITSTAQARPEYCSVVCGIGPSDQPCTAHCSSGYIVTTCATYWQGACCYCPPPPGQSSCC